MTIKKITTPDRPATDAFKWLEDINVSRYDEMVDAAAEAMEMAEHHLDAGSSAGVIEGHLAAAVASLWNATDSIPAEIEAARDAAAREAEYRISSTRREQNAKFRALSARYAALRDS